MSVYVSDPQGPAKAVIIWMHGLGADASDMQGLASELNLGDLAVRHVFIDAPARPVTLNGGMVMPAWYDIYGLNFTDREDQHGIKESSALIEEVIKQQLDYGFASEQIYLSGFSQGGAMALYTALQFAMPLGGVIALSAYLPLHKQLDVKQSRDLAFFFGSGDYDTLVQPSWVQTSIQWLKDFGCSNLTIHRYPMEHSVCMEEIKDISLWLIHHLKGELQ